MLIQALIPLHIRRPGGDLHLTKGQSVELEVSEAQKLLEKAPGKVRVVKETVVTEMATKSDGTPLSQIYWETGTGRILGPAVPEFFFRDGETFWISVTFEGQIRFIRDDRLRSRKAFNQQRPLREVEPIQEWSESKQPRRPLETKRSNRGGQR